MAPVAVDLLGVRVLLPERGLRALARAGRGGEENGLSAMRDERAVQADRAERGEHVLKVRRVEEVVEVAEETDQLRIEIALLMHRVSVAADETGARFRCEQAALDTVSVRQTEHARIFRMNNRAAQFCGTGNFKRDGAVVARRVGQKRLKASVNFQRYRRVNAPDESGHIQFTGKWFHRQVGKRPCQAAWPFLKLCVRNRRGRRVRRRDCCSIPMPCRENNQHRKRYRRLSC